MDGWECGLTSRALNIAPSQMVRHPTLTATSSSIGTVISICLSDEDSAAGKRKCLSSKLLVMSLA